LLIAFSVGISPAAAPDVPANAVAAPFSPGEKITYEVQWNPPWYLFFLPTMHAGEAELSLAGEKRENGQKALQIVFHARSSGTLVKLAGMHIDDRFEYLTEPESFCTLRASKRIIEGKRKREVTVEYLRETGQLHIRETDMAVSPPKVKKDEIKDDVPKCVRDLFSALYYVRRLEFFPGAEHKSLVGDDDKVKEVMSRVGKKEMVRTPGGEFEAWKVDTIALVGGLFKGGGSFKMWLSADERKLPVQFEAKVNIGTVIGKLKTVDN